MLEPDAVKVASPVLRGGGGSNATSLPDPAQTGPSNDVLTEAQHGSCATHRETLL